MTINFLYAKLVSMEQDNPDRQVAALASTPKIYTYADLMDNEEFRRVNRRVFKLAREPQLTEEEKAEFDGMYPAWFKHWYDSF
ncbi:MAG: hypothetical protein G01um101493_209 [Microgenomates group bacterium Gr01-1014_93]|nr:MAG: hypothetical protein G01um101493_209 [Microgenomates group bacterium Gr01-1014_93]